MSLLGAFRRWRRDRLASRVVIGDEAWRHALRRYAFTRALWPAERARLRELVRLFLATKAVTGAGGLEVDDEIRLAVAVQACILVLALGLDYYDGWVEVIVYPGEFVPEKTWTDEAGVVHTGRVPHMGEAWPRGPVVLSWEHAAPGAVDEGTNIVIHEFAHKLDMLNGEANGHPPLHRGMSREAWSEALGEAYHHHRVRVRRREITALDPYAAESPAEFFSVASELFFELPGVLAAEYPAVYDQLRQFYRQDPATRQDSSRAG